MRKGSIYIIKNKCNDKVYIGQTMQEVKERFKQHLKPSTTKQRGSYKIYNAMNKYGKENFYCEVLEEGIDIDTLDIKEIEYISKYDSFNNGYNSTNGGDSKTICKVQDVEILREMFCQNKTHKEMAEFFGVHKETIKRTLHSLGMRKNNVVDKEYLLEHKDIMNNKQIAERFGVSAATVSRAFKKYGIERGRGCSNHLNKQNQKRIK